jgi:hypothetical protein
MLMWRGARKPTLDITWSEQRGSTAVMSHPAAVKEQSRTGLVESTPEESEIATRLDGWRSARTAGGRVRAFGMAEGEPSRRAIWNERERSVWTRLKYWRTARRARAAALRREDSRVGYSIEPHSDGNERADSRIQVVQPDGTMLRPGPPDIHPPRAIEESDRRQPHQQ